MKNRILIVEDDPSVQNLLTVNLSYTGYDCNAFDDGQKAHEWVFYITGGVVGNTYTYAYELKSEELYKIIEDILSTYEEQMITVTDIDINKISIYDYNINGDIPLLELDKSNQDFLDEISALYAQNEPFDNSVGTTHTKNIVLELVDGSIIYAGYGTQGFITIMDGNNQYNVQNEELNEYLYDLIFEYGDIKSAGGMSIDRFNELVDEIASSPKESSNAFDYIDTHKDAYNEIICNMNDVVEEYINSYLIKTENIDLKSRIMSIILYSDMMDANTNIASIVSGLNGYSVKDYTVDCYEYGEKVNSYVIDDEVFSSMIDIDIEYVDLVDMTMRSTGTTHYYMVENVKVVVQDESISFTINNISFVYSTQSDIRQLFND